MDNKSNFAKGSIAGHILYLSVPTIISQLVQMLYNIVDRIYIGHIDTGSGLALTGLGLTFPIVTIIMAFTNLYSTGGTPLFNIARGAEKNERANQVLRTSFTLLGVTALILMGLLYLTMRPLLFLLGASPNSYQFARDYLLFYLAGTLFLMEATGMATFITAQGFSLTAMLINLTGVFVNVILDPIFIFVLGYGISGAAIATVISQLISFSLMILFFRSKWALFKLNFKSIRIDQELLRPIFSLGLAGFTFQATNSVVQVACNITLSQFGGDIYIGIMAVLTSIREFVSAPLIGLTNGAQPVISYNYGAKKLRRVKSSIRFITIVSVTMMVIIWIIILIFPAKLMELFSSSSEIVQEGTTSMFYYFFGFFFMAFQFCGQTVFTGLGLAKQAVFFSLFRKIVIVVPLTLLLPYIPGIGVNGVFIAEPLSNCIGGLICYLTMLFTTRKILNPV